MDALIAQNQMTRMFSPHALHRPDRSWLETNCYIDLWIEVLASLGEVPEAAFGHAVSQQFGDDQFTFSKIPIEDLRRLYGLIVQELSIYRTLEHHVATEVKGGRIVLMEVDAFYLPDTHATTYRRAHTKTTIAVDRIDPTCHEVGYFHNATYSTLSGDDYLGALRLRPEFAAQPDLLPPYVEVVERKVATRDPGSLRMVALAILHSHLARRPRQNPFVVWRHAFPAHVEALLTGAVTFDDYAFHFPRLAGANFELLGDHAHWLAEGVLSDVADTCHRIAQTLKVLQFRLARMVARRAFDGCGEHFDMLERDYDRAISGLADYAD